MKLRKACFLSAVSLLSLLLVFNSSLAGSAAKFSGKINLNTATVDELSLLPGIGIEKAQAIIDLKKEIKEFKKIHDILKVKGLGKKLYARISPLLKLEGQSDLKKMN